MYFSDNAPDLRAGLVPALDVFGEIAIEEVAHRGRRPERPHALAGRVLAPPPPPGKICRAPPYPRGVGRDLAVLTDREPARAAMRVAVAHEVEPPATRHHTDTEAGELVIKPLHVLARHWLEALDVPLREAGALGLGRRADSNLVLHSSPRLLDGTPDGGRRQALFKKPASTLGLRLGLGRVGRSFASTGYIRIARQPLRSCTHRARRRHGDGSACPCKLIVEDIPGASALTRIPS